MKFLRNNWILLSIILLSAVLRLWQISSIPASLNIDEQALGYNAFSLLKTGLDEHGRFFPISLESFGDWKLIGYPLVTIPFILWGGLNDLTVRLPSAFAGITQVVLAYILIQKLFHNKRIALLGSLFLAISPLSIYFSRMAYEVNVATASFLGGLVAFLAYQEKKHKVWFFVCCLLFATAAFTYHSFIIFIPLFSIGLFFLNWQGLKNKKVFYIGAGLLFVLLAVVMQSVFFSNSRKLSDLAVWTDANTVYNRADIFRTDGSNDRILGKVFYSRPFAIAYQIGQNYLATFSPSFLFDKGGEKLVNSLGYFGNFYILDAALLVLGIIAIVFSKIRYKHALLLWFVLGILPSAITKDAPSSTRLFLLIPLACIVLAQGLESLLNSTKQDKWKKILVALFIAAYIGNFLYFVDAYFLHINYQRSLYLHFGYKQAVEVSQKYPTKQVVMIGPENFPYISFLFYTQYDPNLYRKQVAYYPPNHALFDEVKGFGKYRFVDTIDYEHLHKNTLYIDSRGIGDSDMKIILPSGIPIFKYFFKQ